MDEEQAKEGDQVKNGEVLPEAQEGGGAPDDVYPGVDGAPSIVACGVVLQTAPNVRSAHRIKEMRLALQPVTF